MFRSPRYPYYVNDLTPIKKVCLILNPDGRIMRETFVCDPKWERPEWENFVCDECQETKKSVYVSSTTPILWDKDNNRSFSLYYHDPHYLGIKRHYHGKKVVLKDEWKKCDCPYNPYGPYLRAKCRGKFCIVKNQFLARNNDGSFRGRGDCNINEKDVKFIMRRLLGLNYKGIIRHIKWKYKVRKKAIKDFRGFKKKVKKLCCGKHREKTKYYETKMSYIYGIRKKECSKNTIKYGSTVNFTNRIKAYVTPECDFDNSTHEIALYHIMNDKFTCYEIDTILRKTCEEIEYPYKKYNGTGGIEHYHFTTYDEFDNFLENIGVEFEKEMVDVDALRSLTSEVTRKDTIETELEDLAEFEDLEDFEVLVGNNGQFTVGDTTYDSKNGSEDYTSYKEMIMGDLADGEKRTYKEIYERHKDVIPSFSKAKEPWMSINEWLQKLMKKGRLERREREVVKTMEYWVVTQ